MTIILFFCVALLLWFVFLSSRSAKKIKTVDDFMTYGADLSSDKLKDTFAATNVTFLTVFFWFTIYGHDYDAMALWYPISFCLGIVFFAWKIIPKMAPFLQKGYSLAEFLSERFNSKSLKLIVAVFAIVGFWMFYYAEIWGLTTLLYQITQSSQVKTWAPILITLSLSWYVAWGGFRAVIDTDKLQLRLIMIGLIGLVGLIVIHFTTDVRFDQFSQHIVSNSVKTLFASPSFIIQSLATLFFVQMIYYDNWQRLGAFAIHWKPSEGHSDLIREMRSIYISASWLLLIVYIIPIMMGIISLVGEPSVLSLDILCHNIIIAWNSSLLGKIFCLMAIGGFFSAALSTADTYILNGVFSLFRDVLNKPVGLKKALALPESELKSALLLPRILTIVFGCSILPFLLIEWEFGTFVNFLFLSQNGSIVPIALAIGGFSIRPFFAVASFISAYVIGFVLSYLSVPPIFSDYAALWVIACSIVITLLGYKSKSNEGVIHEC
jgi:Na+/proline symporter